MAPKLYHFLNPILINQNTWIIIWYYFCSLFWHISLSYAQLLYPSHLKRPAAHQNSSFETYHEKNSSPPPSKKKLECHIHFGLAFKHSLIKSILVPVGCLWTAVHEPLIYSNLPEHKTTVLQNLKFCGSYLHTVFNFKANSYFQMIKRGKTLIMYLGRYGIWSFKIGCMW